VKPWSCSLVGEVRARWRRSSRSGHSSTVNLAEVYLGANKEKQALECFRPTKAMGEQVAELYERFGVQTAAKLIFQPSTRSRLHVVVKKPGKGASVYLGVLDELHGALEMANPLLGISNDREAIPLDQQEAMRSRRNTFRAKHLNQWTSASAAWMSISAWSKCHDPELAEESVKGCLALKLDLSATIRLHRKRSMESLIINYCLTRCYLPEERVNAPENQHYQRVGRAERRFRSMHEFDRGYAVTSCN
jgi:phage terminase large subunit-like protein